VDRRDGDDPAARGECCRNHLRVIQPLVAGVCPLRHAQASPTPMRCPAEVDNSGPAIYQSSLVAGVCLLRHARASRTPMRSPVEVDNSGPDVPSPDLSVMSPHSFSASRSARLIPDKVRPQASACATQMIGGSCSGVFSSRISRTKPQIAPPNSSSPASSMMATPLAGKPPKRTATSWVTRSRPPTAPS
jgi:hypothetical protein